MNWLCDASEFLTRTECGTGWSPWLKQTYQMANFLIWFSYLVIAFSLYKLYRSKKTELPAPGLFVLATMFLLLCGLSHLGNIATFFWAPYRLFTLVDLLTAAVSVTAACWMPSVVHWMTHLPAQDYVHTVNKTLEDEVSQTVRTKHELIQQVETAERAEPGPGTHDQDPRVDHREKRGDGGTLPGPLPETLRSGDGIKWKT